MSTWAAKPFFAKHGYDFAAAMVTDLAIELEDYQMTLRGVEFETVSEGDRAA